MGAPPFIFFLRREGGGGCAFTVSLNCDVGVPIISFVLRSLMKLFQSVHHVEQILGLLFAG
jgi:hypothetical protein